MRVEIVWLQSRNYQGLPSGQNSHYTGTEKHEMAPYTRYDLRATYDYSDYSCSVYGTFQPHRYGTEVSYRTNSGVVIFPQPSTTVGVLARYYF